MILPVELMLKIYDYSDTETRVKLNKVLNWSYYVKNPFYNIPIRRDLRFRTLVMGTVFTRFASIGGRTIILPY
jgi:hypothetical protein